MFIPSKTIVAAIQFQPKLLDVDYNIKQAAQLAFEAAAKGAKVIVLPELCLSGFVLNSFQEALSCAQTKEGYQTIALAEVAKQMNCCIAFGYVQLYEGNLYNAAAVVGPTGLMGNCQKHNLYGSDNLWATASEQIMPIINTPAGRLGVMICRDLKNSYRESYAFFRPEQKFYRKGSVDTIALLTAWGEQYGYPDSAWIELAEELNCNVIVSNRVGQERDMLYKGGSAVIDRNKQVWTFGSSFTEAAIVGGEVVL